MARLSAKLAQHATGPNAPAALDLTLRRDVLTELALSQIEPDPDQPRKDLGDLSELAASIREMGVVQPIIVSIVGMERYRILAGERRFGAARLAGLERIPAIVRTVEEHDRLQLQILENLHRKDLTPFEEARAYQALADQFNLTQEIIARRLGRSQESVSETLRLLTLPTSIQEGFAQAQDSARGRISKSLLLEIARQPEGERGPLWERARRGELTVKSVRAERKSPARPRPEPLASPAPQRHVIRLDGVVVTLEFADGAPSPKEIRAALKAALSSLGK